MGYHMLCTLAALFEALQGGDIGIHREVFNFQGRHTVDRHQDGFNQFGPCRLIEAVFNLLVIGSNIGFRRVAPEIIIFREIGFPFGIGNPGGLLFFLGQAYTGWQGKAKQQEQGSSHGERD